MLEVWSKKTDSNTDHRCSRPDCIGTFSQRVLSYREKNDLNACVVILDALIDLDRNDETDNDIENISTNINTLIKKYEG